MSEAGRFTVDAGELDAVIGDIERTEAALSTLTDDVERQIRALHQVWEGLAAEAQVAAQAEWNAGMLAMREAVADLRAAARTAHGNYTRAAEANVAMWEGLA
ncbi:MAG: hypothetical protein JWN84_2895 [Nocardioides sp.]|nr:hypothetical protein [Nocardioides sp.]